MIAAIMQPTYLPWAGYFNLIANSDVFVFLDDAQFQKSSWHNRNRVIVSGQPHWLTVPVRHQKLSQKINETSIDYTRPWKKKQIRLLQQAYTRYPYAGDLFELLDVLEANESAFLSDLNIATICWLSSKLELETKVLRSSELGISGERTDRLVDILNYLGAGEYLSPIGASEYLEDDGFLDLTDISLTFQNYTPEVYTQHGAKQFFSHLSIVDVIANLGWHATREYIR